MLGGTHLGALETGVETVVGLALETIAVARVVPAVAVQSGFALAGHRVQSLPFLAQRDASVRDIRCLVAWRALAAVCV